MNEPSSMSSGLRSLLAERFKLLSEPARIALLECLRERDASVTELMQCTQMSQANTSRHLQLLHNVGFVARRRDGVRVVYSAADLHVFALLDSMRAQLEAVDRPT